MERPSGLVSEMVTFAEEAGIDMITYLANQITLEVTSAEWELNNIIYRELLQKKRRCFRKSKLYSEDS